jgi:hypothetical protein
LQHRTHAVGKLNRKIGLQPIVQQLVNKQHAVGAITCPWKRISVFFPPNTLSDAPGSDNSGAPTTKRSISVPSNYLLTSTAKMSIAGTKKTSECCTRKQAKRSFGSSPTTEFFNCFGCLKNHGKYRLTIFYHPQPKVHYQYSQFRWQSQNLCTHSIKTSTRIQEG